MKSMNPEDYYHDLGEEEWERLEKSLKNKLEYINTLDYLEEYLPEEGRILDAGGTSGRYAIWLAKQGYKVTLVDITEKQLEIAEKKIEEEGIGDRVEIIKGDIRDLELEEETYDAVLCLGGPLSHVIEEESRYKAVRELKRVAKKNSPIFISVMGMLATVKNVMKNIHEEICLLPDFIENGDYNSELLKKHDIESTFTRCHFFRLEELENLLKNSGLIIKKLVGLEGPASGLQEEFVELPEHLEDAVISTIKKLREDPAVVDNSEHILAVSYKK